MHSACLPARRRILLSLQPRSNFLLPVTPPGHTSKPRIVLTLQLRSNIPPPGVPPIARRNRESCSRCGHTQILILGGTPGALGGVLQFWVAEHKFWEFLFAKLERGSWRFSRVRDVIISYFAFCMEILIILIPGRPQRRCRVRDARHGGLFASG